MDTRQPRILVVDDSAVDRTIAGRLLEREVGWSVTYAEDGQQALDSIDKALPDVVVTDLDMPALNGLELVTELYVAGFDIPVILMTAKGSEELAVEALNRGAAGYVTKSKLTKELVKTVQRALSSIQATRDISSTTANLTEFKVEFISSGKAEQVFPMADVLARQLDLYWHLKSRERLRVATAIEEALSNALYHGTLELDPDLKESDPQLYYQLAKDREEKEPYSDRRIRVTATGSPSEVRFVISDDGPGFDCVELPADAGLDFLSESTGRGVGLMRAFMDGVSWNARGNEVTLSKSRQSRDETHVRNPASRMILGMIAEEE